MLRHSSNHGTQRLPNDDDEMRVLAIGFYFLLILSHVFAFISLVLVTDVHLPVVLLQNHFSLVAVCHIKS